MTNDQKAATKARRYYRRDRRETVEVCRGIGRPIVWIVGVRSANGSAKRIRSPRLPAVPQRDRCQMNLDYYAADKGWIETGPVWA